MKKISASLVLYENEISVLNKLLMSIRLSDVPICLYVIDNSPTDLLKHVFEDTESVTYLLNPRGNVGFGAAHNQLLKIIPIFDYHIVLNPDIEFGSKSTRLLLEFLEQNNDIGLVSPKILYHTGEIQYLCKRYPSVFVLFGRRFLPGFLLPYFRKYLENYEMRDIGYDSTMDVIYLSGCFMFFRRKYLDEIGYFDENIFMYLEDADITLRMAKQYRSVYFPEVSIYHGWARGSHNSWRLTVITIQSAIYFFRKHGWKFY